MIKSRTVQALLAAGLLSVPGIASADCPTVVIHAATKAFADATIATCSPHHGGFEVKMKKKDNSIVELDISAKGDIELIEEIVPVASIPAAVRKAFDAKYPKRAIVKAEKMTKSDKSTEFEVRFKAGKVLKEATFKADGTFVEEE